jgi:hypothetical protein
VLHFLVRDKHADVAGILIQCEADPNVSCQQPDPSEKSNIFTYLSRGTSLGENYGM